MAKKLAPVVGHAADRMSEWGVTHWDAEYVLNNFDWESAARIPGASELVGNVGFRRLVLVVLPLGGDLYELCTVWAEGKEKRV